MKLLIEIPKEIYEALRKVNEMVDDIGNRKHICSIIYNAVANGIPIKDGGICDICKQQELGTLAICFHCEAKLKGEE